ncbi:MULTISPECIES: helix-turn-helix domain-containing protein [unclassified Streptomyces]|uniref:ArsR/SmtB family transcription factor n=1 Tax=unclassified Streptomyces TaxID=2593676 RepID=UPI002DD89931|nr:helix-turn-helix domain-containing protein [Streptomyces sp. NBC_01775]WSB76956.1 helix-turn-helix domain-containing protein [Streptomyces sp. NBC_01775]WSS43606.1 helix-turn-helix domain-containing protein [Streptomyces sp. NBC_01187]
MSESQPSSGVAGLRVLAHPLRLRLLSLLTGKAYSAAEAARVLGQSQANVSYHLRRLHAAGLVDAAGEVPVRGGTAKRYRHDPDSGERVGQGMPQGAGVEAYLALATALGEELRRRTAQRDTADAGRMTDAEVWLEPAVWEDIKDRADKLGEDLHAHALPPGTEGAVRVSATMVLFTMAPDGDPRAPRTDRAPGTDPAPGTPGAPGVE